MAKWAAIAVAVVLASNDLMLVAAMAVLAVALIGLYRGSRVAWAALLVVEVVALAAGLVDTSRWWVFPLSVVALALLVLKPTRAHVSSR